MSFCKLDPLWKVLRHHEINQSYFEEFVVFVKSKKRVQGLMLQSLSRCIEKEASSYDEGIKQVSLHYCLSWNNPGCKPVVEFHQLL